MVQRLNFGWVSHVEQLFPDDAGRVKLTSEMWPMPIAPLQVILNVARLREGEEEEQHQEEEEDAAFQFGDDLVLDGVGHIGDDSEAEIARQLAEMGFGSGTGIDGNDSANIEHE